MSRKPNTVKKKQIAFYVDESVIKLWQTRYPETMSNYLRHALYAGLNSKEVFSKIFFDVREEIKKDVIN